MIFDTLPKRVMWIVAHPDDEVIGTGGTIAKFTSAGVQVDLLVMTNGEGSRSLANQNINSRSESLNASISCLGVGCVKCLNFPDNAMDSVPLLKIVKEIEQFSNDRQPELIFTHSVTDLNIDHQITSKAVITAHRPAHTTANGIFGFETYSSTEWSFNATRPFQPTVFVDISRQVLQKEKALNAYKNEMRPAPHPRSKKIIENYALCTGSRMGLDACEAFELIWLKS